MIPDHIRQILENLPNIWVATADESCQPHVAIGEHVSVTRESLLVFENWFCPATLQNIARNCKVSVIAADPHTGKGYQMTGTVTHSNDAALQDGHSPVAEKPDIPQVLTRFTVKIENIFEFTTGVHTDMPIAT